jgi:hypothetical protein
MEDLLQALMQGSQPPSGAQGSSSDIDPMGQLLQNLLGGGAAQGSGTQADSVPVQGEMDLASLLQGVLGGAGGLSTGASQTQPASAGGLGSLLGAILGGGSPAQESNGILAPILTRLADKLGLPPQLAQAVVAFVLGKLIESRLSPEGASPSVTEAPQAAPPRGVSVEDVVRRMNSGKWVSKTEIRNAGLAEELAASTGLDRRTAEASLQEVLNALGGQVNSGQ